MENLHEILESLGNGIVRIGTDGGNGFVYIGDASDEKSIDECFNGYLKRIRKTLQLDVGKLHSRSNIEPDLVIGTDTLETDTRYADELSAICEKIRKEKYYIDTYRNVFFREVIDVRECIDPGHNGEHIIIVSGIEDGKCWFKDEYDKINK